MSASRTRPRVLLNHMIEPGGRITGITRYAFGLIEALGRRGNADYVLASAFTREQLPPAIAATMSDIITTPHTQSTPLAYWRQHGLLRDIARRTQPDLTYGMNAICPPAPGLPSIITVHDLYYDVMPELYARRHRLWWRLFFGDAGRRATRIACVSRNTQSDLARFHPGLASKTALAPGAGVAPIDVSPTPVALPGGDEPYVLLLGNITPNKNAPFLLAALRLLRASGRPARAYHVGRDFSGDLARAMAGENAGLLTPLGPLDDAQLDYVLRRAAALVQPSRYEGFGLPIIEAHDRGVPVIASDIPVFREVAGDGALLAPLDDAQALADAIHGVVHDPQLRARLAQGARTNAARFTWDLSAQAAETVIASALSAKR